MWLNIESDETSVHIIWDSFSRQLTQDHPEIGHRLDSGFSPQRGLQERVIDLLEEWASLSSKILVIDDYHFANLPELDSLIDGLVRKVYRPAYFNHTQNRPAINVEEQTEGYCHQLKSSLLNCLT